jgi:hypothetical protein
MRTQIDDSHPIRQLLRDGPRSHTRLMRSLQATGLSYTAADSTIRRAIRRGEIEQVGDPDLVVFQMKEAG